MSGRGDGGPDGFELDLREWMAQDAEAVRPAAVPYQAIVRQGRVERRRRLAVAGAALVALAVVPATAIAVTGDGDGGGPSDRVSAAGGGPTPSGVVQPPQRTRLPQFPATPGQLTDDISFEQAGIKLVECLDFNRQHSGGAGAKPQDLGEASDYRILLALRSTGNDNSPGDGQFIVAVKDAPTQIRLICNVKNGRTSGVNISAGGDANPESGAVVPDMNAGKLHLQRLSGEGPWKLPYRWGSIGTVVDPRVARVTVTYGGATAEAVIDHGWFAATGVLDRPVTRTPRIQGYDAQGTQVYDSDQDRSYNKTIP
ncbi:hypothetical protein OG429_12485 [Streptomyces sp. NBC_00190]|uniref:hypothetical protein n=1 Tax=unclassified Streptomyces TaxID=2593676 RepID=UPI002E29C5F3|nr:hypothetical protein [Streptomyces sp. NBC_00190]